MINEYKPEFVSLSETHLSELDDDSLIQIDNYDMVRNDSASRHTGGVMVYFKKSWKGEVINSMTIDLQLWWLVVKLSDGDDVIYLATLYRAPRYLNVSSEFYMYFESYLDELSEISKKVVIMGDFNIDYTSDSNVRNKLNDIVRDGGFRQIVNQYTRNICESRTLIDYVIVNDGYNFAAEVKSDWKISDHETIGILIKHKRAIINEEKSVRVLKYDRDKFRSKVIKSDIMTTYFSECNEKARNFDKSLQLIVEEFVTNRKVSSVSCPWFSSELDKLKKSKINQYRRATLTGNALEWLKYRSIRNEYKNKINKAKEDYISEKIDNSVDQKLMWKSLKSLVLKENKSDIKEIIFDNERCLDNLKIANKFNKYFVDSVMEINKSIPMKQYVNEIEDVSSVFKFKAVKIEDLHLALKLMNNKRDVNFVNAGMVKDIIDLVGENLLSIVSVSLKSGIFPDPWKESWIIPIAKVRNSIKCEEFRPINMISIQSKILEKIVKDQLIEYLENNNIISEYQSGFRKGHSCESLVNYVVGEWKMAIHENKVIVAVFLDLSRAFETVDREILANKLEKYGIKDNELKWFKSYLGKRKQRTVINGVVSEAVEVDLGVPQGTILGVLFFLLYVNDMNKVIMRAKCVIYVDDSHLYVTGEDVDECISIVNQELKNLSDWLKMNRLKVNLNKTKSMIINDRVGRRLNVLMDGVEIEIVSQYKYLGVVIDDRLDFKSHFDYVGKKIAKKLYFLSKIRGTISIVTSIRIYNVMIRPHLEYCSTILFMGNGYMLSRLQKLQNRGMRIILRVDRFATRLVLLGALQWHSVYQRIVVNVLIFVFKVKYNMQPRYLCKDIAFVKDVHMYPVRNKQDFRLNLFRNNRAQNMLLYNGLKLFNSLPIEIKEETRLLSFKREIIKYVSENFI